jgi:Transposase DDE domain
MMPAAFAPFVKKAPLCVMARIALENLFDPERLDRLFERTAKRQYHRELLFSQVTELMLSVVLRVEDSVHSAFKARKDALGVSDQAVYDKLRCQELAISEALVADSAERLTPVIGKLKARFAPLLPGYRVRILDGNHLAASERRLRVLRAKWAKGLPGRVLAVYEPEVDLVTRVFLTPDGHASERSLLDMVTACVEPNDLWIADRNFCTLKFLLDLEDAKACFVIRQHGTMPYELVGKRRRRGRTATGQVYEQQVIIKLGDRTLRLRRITVVLDKPTRNGDSEVHLLTNLSAKKATAVQVANLYQKRWRIENRFYEVTQTLECEPNTLGYPQAALFAFCLAMVAANGVALIRASLRAVHDPEAVANMSNHYMAKEIRQIAAGMLIVLPPDEWHRFNQLSPAELASTLLEVARHVNPARYEKAKRGPKKPPPPKGTFQSGAHVSTHKLINAGK